MPPSLTRRKLLCGTAALGLLQGCGGKHIACYDPEMLGAGERQMRKTLQYVNVSTNEAQTCAGCQFYQPGDENCGECELLDGPVASAGYCTSWALKL
ncbi:MAG: hypothetical protein HKN19_14590 [Halioglobus sp.]|nr:hypothetical protein [Halioglobus sp.]